MKKYLIMILLILLASLVFFINKKIVPIEKKEAVKKDYRFFQTSFESVDDFKNFYITPQRHKGASHEQSREIVHSGNFSHKAWVYEANEPSTKFKNNNHRAYPTVQFHKTESGSFECPCHISLWAWVDADLKAKKPQNEWLSFATFTSDPSVQLMGQDRFGKPE